MLYVITTMPAGSAAYPERMSRRAVATLADSDDANAIDYITDVLKQHGPSKPPFWSDEVQDQIEALPESGGTVGPLPDGTVIEVERIEIDAALIADLRAEGFTDEEIAAAYKARQQ